MNYDYPSEIADACKLLPNLEGALLENVLIQVVDPEFNGVYLKTNKGMFLIHGKIGGELIGIHRITSFPKVESQNEDIFYRRFEPFEIFENKKIVQARQLGTVWNGHGFELSFEDLYNKTMLIQSIYAGDKPDGFEDCLRLGIGSYSLALD